MTDLIEVGQLDEPLGLDLDTELDTINDGMKCLLFSISTVFGRFYIKISYKY